MTTTVTATPSSQMRTEYLSLMLMVIRQSDYCNHRYRVDDLDLVLNTIANDLGVAEDSEFLKCDVELAEMIQIELRWPMGRLAFTCTVSTNQNAPFPALYRPISNLEV